MLGTVLDRILGKSSVSNASHLSAAQKKFFAENGYLILPKLFSPQAVAQLNDHLDFLWQHRAQRGDLPIDVYFGLPGAARIYFRKAPAEARFAPYKLVDPHVEDTLVQDYSAAPQLVAALIDLLGSRPLVCNSLLFEWGSQQEPHFDTFFMPSKTPNMMAASWIALDTVTAESGPLFYYPGSHKIEPYRFSHGGINAVFSELKTGAAEHIERIVREHDLRREIFLPQSGDVLIWHAQLLHGGSPILDRSQRRRSLVTHYWTECDFPDAEQRIDLGGGRWLLRKGYQYVVDDDTFAEVDAYLADRRPTPEQSAAVPASFDARLYLARNQDLIRASANPWQHYIDHGRAEGRIW